MLQPAGVIITFITLFIIIIIIISNVCWCLPYDSSERTAGAGKNRTRILHHHHNSHSQLGSASEQEHSEHQDFLFPDSQELTEPSSCPSGEPFCETLENYPYDHLKNVLRHTPALDIFFGQDETPPDFTNRVADTGEEKFVCDARSKVVFPQSGKNSKNKWKYIVNQKGDDDDDGYVQGVRIEECVSPGKSCDVFNALPDGYTTSCKQKYVYRRLLCLNDNGAPAVDTFLFPSACCCSYKVDFNVVARSAAVAKTICNQQQSPLE